MIRCSVDCHLIDADIKSLETINYKNSMRFKNLREQTHGQGFLNWSVNGELRGGKMSLFVKTFWDNVAKYMTCVQAQNLESSWHPWQRIFLFSLVLNMLLNKQSHQLQQFEQIYLLNSLPCMFQPWWEKMILFYQNMHYYYY